MENFGLGGGVTLLGVFLLCMCVGIIAGNYLKHQTGTANASSTNITVTNNNQISTIDQGIPTITKTSTVTVKDTTATIGYTLSARISQNTIPGSTVTIYSTSSTICRQASPCTITNNPTPTTVLQTNNNNATQTAGHTTQWTVTITLPTNTSQGNYLLDIEYTEEALPPPTLSDMTYLQDLALTRNKNACADTQDRTRVVLRDRRNNQNYYVQKIANSGANGEDLCWMETNLRYAGDGSWNSGWRYPDDRYATLATNATANPNDNIRPLSTTATGWLGGTETTAYQQAGYFNPGGSTTLDTATPTNNATFYGYLYNWCATMGGQANSCSDNVWDYIDDAISICPAGWRVPTGGPTNGGITSGDFASLNNAINNGSTSNPQGLLNNFLAVYSGMYASNSYYQGTGGYYWGGGGAASDSQAYALNFRGGSVDPGSLSLEKYYGAAVRCVFGDQEI